MSSVRFSANLGFLFKSAPFLDRIALAAQHGFEAVEFHDDAQREDRAAVIDAVAAAGLPVASLNVAGGTTNGMSAIPALENEARRAVDEAVALAGAIDAQAVHVLAGRAQGPDAESAYLHVLQHALDISPDQLTILIEPISQAKMPGYLLSKVEHGARIVEMIANPRLKLLFDCFHVAAEGEPVAETFEAHAGKIGHVQIASYPDRSEPTPEGEIGYASLLPRMQRAGFRGAFGCEYAPSSPDQPDFSWRASLRNKIE